MVVVPSRWGPDCASAIARSAPRKYSKAMRAAPLALLGFAAVLGVACGKSSSAPPSPAAVDAQYKSDCAIRATHTQGDSLACLKCELAVEEPTSCACIDAPEAWKGACKPEVVAVRAEPGCLDIDGCVRACRGDCACAERCYADAGSCKAKATARNVCKTRICHDACK